MAQGWAAAVERRALQIAVVVGSLVPICAGLAGVRYGPAMLGLPVVDASLDSHYRYLSGLLFGIGLAFLGTVPRIEAHSARIRFLTLLVGIGGLARAAGIFLFGIPSTAMLAGLAMELVVTPLLCLWQARVARIAATP
jgi:hypothetical protein